MYFAIPTPLPSNSYPKGTFRWLQNMLQIHMRLRCGKLQLFLLFFKKMGQTRPLFGLFSFFSQRKDKYSTNFTINDKSIDGVLGSQTWGGMMEGADESTVLWRHPNFCYCLRRCNSLLQPHAFCFLCE